MTIQEFRSLAFARWILQQNRTVAVEYLRDTLQEPQAVTWDLLVAAGITRLYPEDVDTALNRALDRLAEAQ